MPIESCRHFSGAKPCGRNATCDMHCSSVDLIRNRILIIHLGALGAVVRSTSLLKSIKRKYVNAHITWVTDRPGDQLLKSHPLIDRVLTTEMADVLQLSALEFEVGFVIDKSLKASGLLKFARCEQVFGFISDPLNGVIVPATPAAKNLWDIGLSNQKKFFENKKPESQLMAEALELPYQRDEYELPLSESEQKEADRRRSLWQKKSLILGINTGCSDVLPAKKWTVEFHRKVIVDIQKHFDVSVVLLGGPEDEARNQRISYGLDVIQSPTHGGLRDGLTSVYACDLVLTGDSLGMHMSIAAKKWTIAWFGPSCAHEIDFYNRGEALLTSAPCSPCWKKTCTEAVMCYDQVSIKSIRLALERGLNETRGCRPDSIFGRPAPQSTAI